jgi:hypothetical protein
VASRAGRLGVDGSTGGVGDGDGDGGGADAGLLRLGGLGGGRDGLRDGLGLGVAGLGADSWVRGDRGRSRVDRVLRSLGGRLGRSRADGVGRVLGSLGGGLGGSRADGVGRVLRSLGAHWVAGVLRVGGSRSGSGLGLLSVSVLGDGGSEASESSDGNGVTHFG